MYTRVRTKGSLTPFLAPWIYYKQTPCSPDTLEGNLSCFVVGEFTTTRDVVTPDFRRKMKEGVIINNPFTSTKETCSFTPAGYTGTLVSTTTPPYAPCVTWKFVRSGANGIGDRVRSIPLDIDQIITDACTDALGKIDDPTAEGMVIVAELQKTISMLKAPLAGIAQALSSVGKVRGVASGVSNQYLMWIFGVLPLMHDIENILKALQTAPQKRRTARSLRSTSATINWTRPYTGEAVGTVTGVGTRTVSVRAGSLYEFDFDLGISKYGFSISNIPSALWELMPYSFVVDWFLNVQQFIAALSPTIGVKRLAEWYSIHDVTVRREILGSVTTGYPGSWVTSGGGDVATSIIETKTRVPVNLGDHIGIVFRPRFNTSQIISSIALITQKLKL